MYKCQIWMRRITNINFLILFCFSYHLLINMIPSQMNITAGEEEQFDFKVPVSLCIDEKEQEVFDNLTPQNQSNEIHLSTKETYQVTNLDSADFVMSCKLFGIIPVKNVAVSVVPEETVVPCGEPIGIYVKTKGIMIIGTGAVTGENQMSVEPAATLVKSGDYIYKINGQEIENKEEFIQVLNANESNKVTLSILRGGESIEVQLNPVQTSEGEYKLGIWVRDDLAGIGTMTYVKKDLSYGALGHGVNDADTSLLLDVDEGKVYDTTIVDIVQGEDGSPGELSGVINYSEQYCVGNIERNTNTGISGHLKEFPESLMTEEAMKVGLKQEVEIGAATILCDLNQEGKEFQIEITEINYNDADKKEIVFHVTDDRLLALTGGIVQGMSGSPIIQNGKFIGAVTHVFVNDPTKGYGIFAETMLE